MLAPKYKDDESGAQLINELPSQPCAGHSHKQRDRHDSIV